MSWVEDEKAALVATLRRSDPDADTLCAGWDVRRLLAHLVQREQDPVAMIKDAAAKQPAGQEPGLGRLSDGARTPSGYADLVTRFEAGPSRWSPMSWAAGLVNLVEYVIHHEDIRRGSGPAEPRSLPDGQQAAISKQLGTFGRLQVRSAPVGVAISGSAGGDGRVLKKGRGVTLTGDPVELALFLSGRRAVARVEVSGDPESVAAFESWTAAG